MLEGYVNTYGSDPQWNVIATEQPFRVRITREGKPVALFASRWDGVVRNLADGRIYLVEHKTASQIMTAYLELDDQGGAYWAVANQVLRAKKVLKPGEEIAGIIYNFLRKALPDERPMDETGLYLNKDGSISKNQGSPRFVREIVTRSPAEAITQLDRIADEVAVMNALRTGAIPLTKTPTKDCPRCPLWGPCTLHERGADSYLSLLKANYVRIDPYEDTRKAA